MVLEKLLVFLYNLDYVSYVAIHSCRIKRINLNQHGSEQLYNFGLRQNAQVGVLNLLDYNRICSLASQQEAAISEVS